MKRLILTLIIILFSFASQAQLIMIDSETGEYRYEDVVAIEGVSKSQIKERAAKWLHAYHKSTDSISMDSTSIHQKNSYKYLNSFVYFLLF